MSAGATAAAAFVRREGLESLLGLVRARYVANGEARGRVRIAAPTSAERRVLAELLGRRHKIGPVSFTLVQLDEALRSSSFGCSLGDLLAALQGSTVLTRPMEKQLRRASHDAWLNELESTLLEAPKARLAQGWGRARLPSLHRRFKDAPAPTRGSVRNAFGLVLKSLGCLPCSPPERLAVFAASMSRDPHAFDRDRLAGQLLTSALFDLAGDETSGTRPTAEARAAVFAQFGLLVDTVWATVAAFNLGRAVTVDGTPDLLVEAARGRVLNLSSRQLARWRSIEPSHGNVYVVENPSVFETLVDRLESMELLPRGGPTIICTAGYLSQPALRLLDLVVQSDRSVTLWYSGDFDPEGLEIASSVLSRYPDHSRTWRLDVADYERCVQSGVPAEEARLRGLERMAAVFLELVAAMRREGAWVYQEALVELFFGDMVAAGLA